MKLHLSTTDAGRRGGFTLMEIVVAMGIFVLVISGILAAHLVGLRMYQTNETKLAATEWARRIFGKITDEVRTCDAVQIWNVTGSNFSSLLPGETQQGNGLMIYPTTDTNHFIVYYVNTADQTFRRATEAAGSAVILADAVTNTLVFTAKSLNGGSFQVLSNSQNNEVIHVKLEFYRPERFQQDADYYKLETSVTRRALQ